MSGGRPGRTRSTDLSGTAGNLFSGRTRSTDLSGTASARLGADHSTRCSLTSRHQSLRCRLYSIENSPLAHAVQCKCVTIILYPLYTLFPCMHLCAPIIHV